VNSSDEENWNDYRNAPAGVESFGNSRAEEGDSDVSNSDSWSLARYGIHSSQAAIAHGRLVARSTRNASATVGSICDAEASTLGLRSAATQVVSHPTADKTVSGGNDRATLSVVTEGNINRS